MTDEERKAILALGEKCKAKGCVCLPKCYEAFNRFWHFKAEVCSHPNQFPPGPPYNAQYRPKERRPVQQNLL